MNNKEYFQINKIVGKKRKKSKEQIEKQKSRRDRNMWIDASYGVQSISKKIYRIPTSTNKNRENIKKYNNDALLSEKNAHILNQEAAIDEANMNKSSNLGIEYEKLVWKKAINYYWKNTNNNFCTMRKPAGNQPGPDLMCTAPHGTFDIPIELKYGNSWRGPTMVLLYNQTKDNKYNILNWSGSKNSKLSSSIHSLYLKKLCDYCKQPNDLSNALQNILLNKFTKSKIFKFDVSNNFINQLYLAKKESNHYIQIAGLGLFCLKQGYYDEKTKLYLLDHPDRVDLYPKLNDILGFGVPLFNCKQKIYVKIELKKPKRKTFNFNSKISVSISSIPVEKSLKKLFSKYSLDELDVIVKKNVEIFINKKKLPTQLTKKYNQNITTTKYDQKITTKNVKKMFDINHDSNTIFGHELYYDHEYDFEPDSTFDQSIHSYFDSDSDSNAFE